MSNSIIIPPLTSREEQFLASMPAGCIYLGRGPLAKLFDREGRQMFGYGKDINDPGLYRMGGARSWYPNSVTGNLLNSDAFVYAVHPETSIVWPHIREACELIMNGPSHEPIAHEF